MLTGLSPFPVASDADHRAEATKERIRGGKSANSEPTDGRELSNPLGCCWLTTGLRRGAIHTDQTAPRWTPARLLRNNAVGVKLHLNAAGGGQATLWYP